MNLPSFVRITGYAFLILGLTTVPLVAQSTNDVAKPVWNQEKAAEFLDSRASWWLDWQKAKRGNGSSCISCHTGVPYLLVRQSLQKAIAGEVPEQFNRTLAIVKKRVENFDGNLPFYDFKKEQSLGTEAILNALILTTVEKQNGSDKLSEEVVKSFEALWSSQIPHSAADQEPNKNVGGWHWLDFKLEPLESAEADYYGATLAAIAVGSAAGKYAETEELKQKIESLKKYLRSGYQKEHWHNKIAALVAANHLSGILTKQQKQAIISTVFEKQKNGGWSLASLGKKSADPEFKWTAKNLDALQKPDAYATGLVLVAMIGAGVKQEDERIREALDWLKSNQREDGSWAGVSLNYKNPPHSFMNDTATAYAVMALLMEKKTAGLN